MRLCAVGQGELVTPGIFSRMRHNEEKQSRMEPVKLGQRQLLQLLGYKGNVALLQALNIEQSKRYPACLEVKSIKKQNGLEGDCVCLPVTYNVIVEEDIRSEKTVIDKAYQPSNTEKKIFLISMPKYLLICDMFVLRPKQIQPLQKEKYHTDQL